MKKHHKKSIRKVHSHKRDLHSRWLKRMIAFFAVVVLVSGFGAICVYFAHSSAAVLGAHIVVANK